MGLFLFGISFGFVEAAVVVYIRTIYEPMRLQVYSKQAAADLFPMMTLEQLRATAPETVRLVGVELVREIATLLMIAGVALAAAGGWKLWLPAFAVAFGTWDLFYYVFLKVLIDWPASLFTWDILFLIPAPWAAPVLAPVVVSVSLIVTGLMALRRSVRMHGFHWIALVMGCGLILLSFLGDFARITTGGIPDRFAWTIFGTGELLGVSAFLHAVRQSPHPVDLLETRV